MVATTKDGFQILVGSGAILAPCLELGASGGILAVANLAPGCATEIYASFVNGNLDEAAKQQEMLSPVHNAVVGGMGIPGVKAGLDALGLRGGDPRRPLAALSGVEKGKVVQLLQELGLELMEASIR